MSLCEAKDSRLEVFAPIFTRNVHHVEGAPLEAVECSQFTEKPRERAKAEADHICCLREHQQVNQGQLLRMEACSKHPDVALAKLTQEVIGKSIARQWQCLVPKAAA